MDQRRERIWKTTETTFIWSVSQTLVRKGAGLMALSWNVVTHKWDFIQNSSKRRKPLVQAWQRLRALRRCWHLGGARISGWGTPCTRGRSASMPSHTTAPSPCMTVTAWKGTSCGATERLVCRSFCGILSHVLRDKLKWIPQPTLGYQIFNIWEQKTTFLPN